MNMVPVGCDSTSSALINRLALGILHTFPSTQAQFIHCACRPVLQYKQF